MSSFTEGSLPGDDVVPPPRVAHPDAGEFPGPPSPRGVERPQPSPEPGARTEVLDLGPGAAPAVEATATYARVEDAWEVEYPRLVRMLTLYCGDRETALDLAQETMARGCANWARVSRMDSQRAWFTRVALNLANSRWRRLRAERRRFSVLVEPAVSPEMFDTATAMTVRAAVTALTQRQRTAVILRYFDDLDVAATAAVMGCSSGTVKKLTARGLASLRLSLDVGGLEEGAP
jgi:RNA polymerase sigma factor (sigma-70 family)